jgi:thiamine phosphate synthase YjbQ (UPF0047 family)
LAESGIQEGLVLVNPMQITASVFINDDDVDYTPITRSGWKNCPSRTGRQTVTTIPERITRLPYQAQIMGREVVFAVTRGRLDFGTWEQIFYGEFDGRRPKRIFDQNHRRVNLCLLRTLYKDSPSTMHFFII